MNNLLRRIWLITFGEVPQPNYIKFVSYNKGAWSQEDLRSVWDVGAWSLHPCILCLLSGHQTSVKEKKKKSKCIMFEITK